MDLVNIPAALLSNVARIDLPCASRNAAAVEKERLGYVHKGLNA